MTRLEWERIRLEETGLIVAPAVAVHVRPLVGHRWESIARLVSDLNEFSRIVEICNGVVEPCVVVTPSVAVCVDPLEGVVRECIVDVSPPIKVRVWAALSVVFEGFTEDIGTIITAWHKAVVAVTVFIRIRPLEWIFREGIDRIDETVTVVV